MNSKKILLVTIGIFIFVVAGICIYNYSTTNYAEVYSSTITINEAGDADISETLVINFKSYYNYIYRDINTSKGFEKNPLMKGIQYNAGNSELVKNSVKVKVYEGNIYEDNVKEITEEVYVGKSYNGDKDRYGEDIECPCYNNYCYNNCESLYIDANDYGKFEGTFSFTIEYTIVGMVTSYNDCAELNYVMFDFLGFKTKEAAVRINLPNSTYSKEDIYGYVHSASSGSYTQDGNHAFDIYAKNVSSDDKLEFRVIFPKDIIKGLDEKYTVNADMKSKILNYEEELSAETALLHTIQVSFDILAIVVVVGLVVITIIVYKKYDKEFIPKFDNEYYRELPSNYPPAIMSYLYYFQKTNDEDFSATILNLVRRKYLELNCLGDINDKKADYELVFTKKEIDGLMPHEKNILNFIINIIGNGERVTFGEIESYGKSYGNAQKFQDEARKFTKSIEKDAKNFDFFIDTKKAKAKVSIYGVIGILIGILIALIGSSMGLDITIHAFAIIGLSIIYLIYVASIKKRSINGNEEYAMWKAFRHFLCDFGTLQDYSVSGIDIWEEYLVYATSLKVAEKVMEQLKVKLPQMDTADATFLYHTPGNHFYSFYMINRINHMYARGYSNAMGTIAAHNARNSGGSGGHGGGFSGGSSFGGGGGGFRGGR